MHKSIFPLLATAGMAIFALAPNNAEAGIGVGAKAGTLGIGGELTVSFGDHFALRGGFYNYETDYDTTEGDIDYRLNADLDNRALYLDFHPFGGTFRLTAGMVDFGTNFTGVATTTGPIDINGTTYNTADIGELNAVIGWGDGGEKVPYFGIGWSTAPDESGFGLSFDLGLVKAGEPDTALFVVGGNPTIVNDPTFQANLAAEQQQFQEDANDFDTYPVIALGLSFTF